MKKHKVLASCSHILFLCFVDSAPTVHPALVTPDVSAESWRMERAQSDTLPSSQELTCPWLAGLPPLPIGWDPRDSRCCVFFFQHSVLSWVAKQITLCSQISEWKWELNYLWTFWFVGEFWMCFFGFISAKRLLMIFFLRISDLYICSPFKCKCLKIGIHVFPQLTSDADLILSPFHPPLFPLFILLYWF